MKKIMVVEDEVIIAMSYTVALRKAHFNVPNVIETGEEAVKAILSEKPDLVLMDITLKGKMDGIDAAEQILKRRAVPIIFMSGNGDTETKKRALSINPTGYFNKPVNLKVILSKIEKIVK